MDRIALISDIHGNLPALHAALRDIERRRIQRIFCLGDLVGKGPNSETVVDICRAVCERTIKGNWDDALASTDTGNPTLQWHQRRLGTTRLAFLRDLPKHHRVCDEWETHSLVPCLTEERALSRPPT
jgi:protein phosphatase